MERHTLAGPGFGLLFASLLFAGCFGSHGTPGDSGPAPTPDGGTGPADPPDDPPIARPMPTPDPPPSTGCRESGPARSVRVTSTSEFGGRCEMGPFAGAAFYDVSTRPDLDGLSLLVDFCPDADDDCVCDVVVGGIGADVIDDIAAAAWSGPLSGEIQPDGIVLEAPCGEPSCPDGMCACVPTLVLAAADGPLDAPPVRTAAVTVSSGPEVCRISDSGECDFVMWSLDAITWSSGFPGAIGAEVFVEQGQTVRGEELSGITFRALRASGLDCGTEPSRGGAWAAWGTFEGV